MNKCPTEIIIVLVAGLGLLTTNPVFAGDLTLVSKPSKCVSLKQGSICYQDVRMQWKSEQPADYCLYNQAQSQPLKCWQQIAQGEFEFEFAYPQTQKYVIRRQGQNEDLATASIEVKWVYKARRNRSSWRVF